MGRGRRADWEGEPQPRGEVARATERETRHRASSSPCSGGLTPRAPRNLRIRKPLCEVQSTGEVRTVSGTLANLEPSSPFSKSGDLLCCVSDKKKKKATCAIYNNISKSGRTLRTSKSNLKVSLKDDKGNCIARRPPTHHPRPPAHPPALPALGLRDPSPRSPPSDSHLWLPLPLCSPPRRSGRARTRTRQPGDDTARSLGA